MAWLDGWSYRKSVTLSRASGVVTNYQMKLLVGESSGATGEDIDCGGLCLTTFNDIRFTKSDGLTYLDYWIESISGTTPNQLATIWIEFDSIGTTDTTFYMYYGNSSATAYSNGPNTFLFFDDFASLDTTTKWQVMAGSATATTDGSLTVLQVTSNDANADCLDSRTTWGPGNAVRARLKSDHYNSTSYLEIFSFMKASNWYGACSYYCHTSAGVEGDIGIIGASPVSYTMGSYWTAGEYHIEDILHLAASNNKVYIDGILVVDDTSTSTGSDPRLIRFYTGQANAQVRCDWVLVRQCLETEPVWGSWGTQEEPSEGIWLDEWSYRKLITLSRSSGEVFNYQMKLLVGESSGATGENVDCGGLCQTDFDDLRFVDFNGTILDYWIESISGTTPNQLATIWIEFKFIGPGATTFYMYYGNAGATTVSSGANTFPFFDHFTGTSLDTSIWTLQSGSVSVADSIIRLIYAAGNYGNIIGKTNFGVNYRFRGMVKFAANSAYCSFGFCDTSNYSDFFHTNFPNVNVLNAVNRNPYPTETAVNLGNIDYNAYHIFEVKRNYTTNAKYLIDDSLVATISASLPSARSLPAWLVAQAQDLYCDWLFVSQYAETEPVWGSWGDQETSEIKEDFTLSLESRYLSLEDFPLSLDVWGQALEDFTLSLSASSYTLEDFTLSLESRYQDLEDFTFSLEVWGPVLEDFSLSLDVWGQALEDFTLSLESRYLSLEDFPLSLDVWGQALEDFTLSLEVIYYTSEDLSLSLDVWGQALEDFTLSLNASGYAPEDFSLRLMVIPSVRFAKFGANIVYGIAPLTIKFRDLTEGATSWSWDFGDSSSIITTQNPTHIYTTAGEYTVIMTVGSIGGGDLQEKTFYIIVIEPSGFSISGRVTSKYHQASLPVRIYDRELGALNREVLSSNSDGSFECLIEEDKEYYVIAHDNSLIREPHSLIFDRVTGKE
jgi:hypothetical protein